MWSIALVADREMKIISETEPFSSRAQTEDRLFLEVKHGCLGVKKASAVNRAPISSATTCTIEDTVERCRVYMQGYVKHGDYLRTLGGTMTAQCKVLHLLSSQSDYQSS